MAIGIHYIYDEIETKVKRAEDSNYLEEFEKEVMMENVINTNLVLYQMLQGQESNINVQETYYRDGFNIITTNLSKKKKLELENTKNQPLYRRRDIYYNWYEKAHGLTSLLFYGKDETGSTVYSNKRLEKLISDETSQEQKKDLLEQYSYCIILTYDSNGGVQVTHSQGIEKAYVKESLNNRFRSNQDLLQLSVDCYQSQEVQEIQENFEAYYPKDTTYVFAIPKGLSIFDSVNVYYPYAYRESAYADFIAPYLMVVMIIIAMYALFIPYKHSKEYTITKQVLRISFEPLVIGLCVLIGVSIPVMGEMIRYTNKGYFYDVFSDVGIGEQLSYSLPVVINIVVTMLFIYSVFVTVVLLKKILIDGGFGYFKEKSWVVRVIRFVMQKTRKGFLWMTSFDWSEPTNRKLSVFLMVNLGIIAFLCCFWFVGIIFAIAYTIVLFGFLVRRLNESRRQYSQLVKVVDNIADGNFDMDVEETLGMFEPLHRKLRDIKIGFKKAVDEEVKSQNMRTELITNVSHDLKTPLTSIITYVNLLKDEHLEDEKVCGYIDIIDTKSKRLKILIEDLFEMSKANTGNIQVNLIDVDLVSLLKQVMFELEDRINASSLTFRCNLPGEKIVLQLDSQKTYRIFSNIVINAIKYSLANTRVYIDVTQEKNEVFVCIRNISAHEMEFSGEEVLERFVRGDRSRNTEGSGLGLAIAKSFTQLQGGDLKVIVDGDLFKVLVIFPMR